MLRRILFILALALLGFSVVGVGLLSVRGTAMATSATNLSLPRNPSSSLLAPTPTAIPAPPEQAAAWQPASSPAPQTGAWVFGLAVLAVLVAALTSRVAPRVDQPSGANANRGNKAVLRVALGALILVVLAVCGIIVISSPMIRALPQPSSAPAATEPATFFASPTAMSQATATPIPATLAASPTAMAQVTGTQPLPTAAGTQVQATLAASPILPIVGATQFPPPTVQPEIVVVDAEWPQRMEVSDSGVVRVSLVCTTGGQYQVTVEGPGNVGTAFVISPLPGSTLNAPLPGAFGTDYRGFAAATLIGSGFQIVRLEQTDRQSLDQNRLDWHWSIRPTGDPGRQTLLAGIEGTWEPVSGQGSSIQLPLWRSSFEVTVTKPVFATGQLNLMTLLSGLLGSVLSVPWLYERFKSLAGIRKPEAKRAGGKRKSD